METLKGKKVKSGDAANAFKHAAEGDILSFKTENINILNSKIGKIEMRVKRRVK